MAQSHNVVPDKVVSSPLGRAMATAGLVATELLGPDAAVESCEGIIERCYGTFEEAPTTPCPPTSGIRARTWSPSEEREAKRYKNAW